MQKIIRKLSEKFGKDNIVISFAKEQFDLRQTGVNFYSSKLPKKDLQLYLYGDGIGLISIPTFNKSYEPSLAWLIAVCYVYEELGSEFPTHLICISGIKSTQEKNGNGIIYLFDKNQIKKEYEKYVNKST